MRIPASTAARAQEPKGAHDRRVTRRLLLAFCAGLCPSLVAGCYDGGALVNEARSAAQRTRLAEVDLGIYRTTMPKDDASDSLTELELHLFGTVPRYRVSIIEQQLQSEDFRLRHEMLAAVRQSTASELAEPNLTQLRARIEKVVNDILKDSPVEMIGFYDVRVNYR
ncbi:MAG: hypothetical protein WD669_10265 [Pirellulales bacterium]